MPDNFELLADFCRTFTDLNQNPDSFLFGQVIVRKKDEAEGQNVKTRVIRDLTFKNTDLLMEKKDDVVKLCRVFGGRAYLNVNPRSFRKMAIDTAGVCLDYLRNGGEEATVHAFATACGRRKGDLGFWVIDVDNIREVEAILGFIPVNHYTLMVPTVNGAHLLSKGFDCRKLREAYPHVEIHKNNPTLLYAP